MQTKYLFRLLSALLAAVMLLQTCGCNSVLVETVRMIELEEDTDEEEDWSFDAYTTQTVDMYASGKSAFYFDESKCVSSEIEEFQLLACTDSQTMYYFTAPASKSYNSNNGNTNYYCLAVYNYDSGQYEALEEGFYNKNNSVSMASDTDSGGTCFACIGNTFLLISGMKIQNKFTLDEDDKKEIRNAVGKDYICIDIALIDPYIYCVAAVYMDASDLEDENADEPECAIFVITFDTSEDADHDIKKENSGLDSASGSVCSSYVDYASSYTGDVYYYHEGDGKDYIKLETHAPFREIDGSDNFKLSGKSKDENLLTFSVGSFDDQYNYIYTLFSNRLEIWKVTETEKNGSVDLNYDHLSRFLLDESYTYVSMDDVPSVRVISKDKIYTSSLTEGFRMIASTDSGNKNTTFANGAYYAAYSEDDTSFTLIGFNSTQHDRATVTYKNGKEVSRQVSKKEYTMGDLPFAKIYTAYVGA